jgi:chromosomal replication initiation ATPase DnaA
MSQQPFTSRKTNWTSPFGIGFMSKARKKMPHKIINRPARVQAIINEVAAEYDLDPEQLTGMSRARRPSHARFVCYARIINEMQIRGEPPSLPQIGGWFGGRDHTSILHGLRSISTDFEWKGYKKPGPQAGVPNYRQLLAERHVAELQAQLSEAA